MRYQKAKIRIVSCIARPRLANVYGYFLLALCSFSVAGLLTPSSARAAIISSTAPKNLQSGLVGWWTMDGKDVVNGVALDKSGNGNNGNLMNISTSTFYTTGKIGQAFNFDGVDDNIETSNTSFNFERTDKFSFAIWYKSSPGPSGSRSFFGNSNGVVGYFIGFVAGYDCPLNSIGLMLSQSSGPTNKIEVCSPASDSLFLGWHHVVVTYDGSVDASGIKIYIDGINQNLTVKYNVALTYTIKSNQKLEIGDDRTNDPFLGTLDDARVYNRALSQAEITQLYNMGGSKVSTSVAPTSGLASGLVGYWTFDGKDILSGVMQDKSGNGNNGNLMNISSSTFYVAGRIGQAGNFDGTSDYVKSASSGVNTSAGAYNTVSFWMKWNGDSSGRAPFYFTYAGYYGLYFSNSSCFGFNTGNGDVYGITNTTALNNKWAHVTAVFYNGNYTGNNLIYINGIPQSMSQCAGAGTAGTAGGDTYIGRLGNVGVAYFGGSIDDFRIYNRVLSGTEVKQLYNLGK